MITRAEAEVQTLTKREPRWLSIAEVVEKAERGIVDDSMDAVPPFGLKDWDIRGEPEPEEAAVARHRAQDGE
jgi:hypothetical protein